MQDMYSLGYNHYYWEMSEQMMNGLSDELSKYRGDGVARKDVAVHLTITSLACCMAIDLNNLMKAYTHTHFNAVLYYVCCLSGVL